MKKKTNKTETAQNDQLLNTGDTAGTGPSNDGSSYKSFGGENPYLQLLEMAPDAFFRGSAQGKLLYVNKSGLALTGYTQEELLSMSIQEMFPAAILEEKPLRFDLLKEGKVVKAERMLRTKSGKLIPVEMHSRMMPDGTFQSFMRDISERKRAEEALRASEEKYRDLFEKSDDAILIIENRTFVDCNDATVRMLRYNTKEELLKTHPSELSPEFQTDGRRSYEKADEMMRTALENGSHRFEWDHKRADGEIFPVEVLLTAISVDDNRQILHTVWRDITNRKRAKERLQRAKEYSENLINTANVVFVQLNSEGGVVRLNEAAEQITGYRQAEIQGKNWFETLVPKDRYPHVWELFNNITRNGRIPKIFENPMLTKNGQERHIAWQNSMLKDNGNVVGTISFGMDITERKQAEEKLFQAQKMDSIGNLAGGVAHDFNNMLGGIMGYASMLLMKETDPQKKNSIEAIIRAAERASELTQKLLAFGRKGKHLVQPIDMNEAVYEIYSLLERSVDKRIEFEDNLDRELFTIDGDPAQMHQVVINLCVNASHAMAEGGVLTTSTKNVTLNEAEICRWPDLVPGDYVQLTVADTGHGMEEEVRRRAFEPFFSTKEDGDVKGTGLGLATVYGIVKNHGGSVEITSEVGKGTRATIMLPRGKKQAELKITRAEKTEYGHGRILVVDDEEIVRQMAKDMLESLGYEVLTAQDGLEGVRLYAEQQKEINGVILDLKMPKMDGKETFVRMKQIDPDIRALLSTGYGLNEEVQSILDEGALGLVAKPYRLQELSDSIKKLLR
jgi:two-component system, cell cycle sensor histidine kinase and response regulator CckA